MGLVSHTKSHGRLANTKMDTNSLKARRRNVENANAEKYFEQFYLVKKYEMWIETIQFFEQ